MGSSSEARLGEVWDHCLADLVTKLAGGLAAGGAASLLLMGRRVWPVHLAAGAGLGLAISNCQHSINQPNRVHIKNTRILKE